MITKPGVYPNISLTDYHGAEICVGPSISASGLKRIADCPLKYWYYSALNPNRPEPKQSDDLDLGSAAHDLILDGVGWPDRYHVLPPGFSRAASVKQAEAIAEANAAALAGKTLLKRADHDTVLAMAEAIKAHPIHKQLSRGKAEHTIAWQDAETGVWLRCRPDFLPDHQRFIPDYKTTKSAKPSDFARDVLNYGYHLQAALYLDGLESVFGVAHRDFYFIAQEKEPPYIVQPIALDEEYLSWGRKLIRQAIRTFAKCLETGNWPAYSDDFATVSLPKWKAIELETTYTGEAL